MNYDVINNIITIIKLSEFDLTSLKIDYNKKLLERLWNWFKPQINYIYEICEYNEYIDIKNFPNIVFTLNPKVTNGYDPTDNKLKFNLWAFFFAGTMDNIEYPICIESVFQRSAELLHELDHYLFIKEHEKIGLSHEEQQEFEKDYGQELEKRAYEKMYEFYSKVELILSETYPIYLLNKEMIKNEYVIPKKIEINTNDIMSHIKIQIKKNIETIELGYDVYLKSSENTALERVKNVANLFGFMVRLKENEMDYDRIEIIY